MFATFVSQVRIKFCFNLWHITYFFSDSSAEGSDTSLAEEYQRLPLEEAFGDEVSGDVVPAPAPLPQRAPAPVEEPDSDQISTLEEAFESLNRRPFTVSKALVSF